MHKYKIHMQKFSEFWQTFDSWFEVLILGWECDRPPQELLYNHHNYSGTSFIRTRAS